MIASTLWLEITISGFIFLLSGAFIVLKILGIHDLGFVQTFKDYLAVTGVGTIVASYILGILFHRLITMLGKAISPLFRKPHVDSYTLAQRGRVAILQYGSDRLLKEMDYQFNFLALFSQLSVALPLLGITAALWLADTANTQLAVPILVIGLLIGAGFIVVRASQSQSYRSFKNDAYLEVAPMRKGRSDG